MFRDSYDCFIHYGDVRTRDSREVDTVGGKLHIVVTTECVLAEIDAVDDGGDYFFAGRVVHHGAVSL